MRRCAVALCLSLLAGLAHAADRITPIAADTFGAELEARKGRVLLVNFWATWCRPCLEEIPVLQALASQDPELDLVPVSLDDAGARANVAVFIQAWFPGFRSWLSQEREMDALVSVIDTAWNEVLPTTYVIDRSGQVTARLQGGKSADEFAAAVALARDGDHLLAQTHPHNG